MARFKVGDKVRGSKSGVYPTKDDVGVVVELHPDSKAVTVRSEKYGRDIDYLENDLVAANSAPRSTNPVVANALAANAIGRISDADLKRHAFDFCRSEFNKIAQNLKREYNAIYQRWMKTGIAQGAVRAGTADAKTVEAYIDEYMRRLDSAANDIEGL